MNNLMRKLPIGIQTFEELETEWKTYPVLHLDLNAKKNDTIDDLYAIFNQHLEIWE